MSTEKEEEVENYQDDLRDFLGYEEEFMTEEGYYVGDGIYIKPEG